MESFNISNFRDSITDSYHKNSHFVMEIGSISAMDFNESVDVRNIFKPTKKKVTFEIEQTTLPGIALATQEIRRNGFGPISMMPYTSIFDTVPITVRSDSDGKLYDFFSQWMKLISRFDMQDINSYSDRLKPTSNSQPYEISYRKDYSTIATIKVFNDTGKATTIIDLIDCFPIHIGNVSLDWSSNAILKFPATLTFTNWYSRNIDDVITSDLSPIPVS